MFNVGGSKKNSCHKPLRGSPKKGFRNLCLTKKPLGGSLKKGFRNLRSTQEVRKITPAFSCSGGSLKKGFRIPRSTASQISAQRRKLENNSCLQPLGNPRSTQEVRKRTLISRLLNRFSFVSYKFESINFLASLGENEVVGLFGVLGNSPSPPWLSTFIHGSFPLFGVEDEDEPQIRGVDVEGRHNWSKE
ncbi:hypothetical protein V8G54_018827 [Vigna mungo]|uniref:Uncharacterized protein n=1 Tax=Vigna mungo TaxID=3915 RepID=A0AAQ3NAW6_VIGMU